MQFTFHSNASSSNLEIDGDLYKYLIKARRHKVGDIIPFRNLNDNFIYYYELSFIDRKKADFKLKSNEEKVVENSKKLHLGWCMVDPKTVEKVIASLNELGVDKITFIYCEYSQKNFKINIEKLEKILINSSSQCGRSSIIKLEICNSLKEFLKQNPDSFMLDFSLNHIDTKIDEVKTLVIGCEGGFSKNERKGFLDEKVVGFNSNLILRSETAVVSVSSKILV
ncbi:16S rRNA (uracil(1498)-N(3))-methyltransferase [Halarcobacter ebronensis]|uniref:Ribosomal RNA small subunit methyltransferase E n=1 Tax=Halarcobacter ebronensis TaxID=1462615 RepID=A0A4Q1AS40_9BACT|nr:16S rRNA (uracil(1498)-N(3))-methyltransferase [Halarcobacter ebronensis]QKF80960.1 16S rRNA m3U1498 methyltransferase [Halarcobacter ebronensis]RXK06278.1 16S rRNA (uracil(1498)-N(3))-methyltransferase [Halarcobacter ebronensis]